MRISQSIFAKLIYLTVSLGVTGIAYSQTVDRDDRFPKFGGATGSQAMDHR